MSKNKNNSYNINDYYMWYKHNRPKSKEYFLTEKQHNDIVREVFTALAEHLTNGHVVQLGPFLGTLEMFEYAYENRVWIDKDNKFHDHRPVDWDIWNKKQRGEIDKGVSHKWNKPIPLVMWNKHNTAKLKNKNFLGFYISDSLKKKAFDSFNNNELYLRKVKDLYDSKSKSIFRLWHKR